ncbi:homogentisate 1,2-dioxygenase [Nocardia asteroides]|uniref:homogentisate 1,2-dioxygenase n=1 Tax=Nocardia asteroides TaxID=1824 RepID=UPI001E2C1497|nr:homogentisate 1,2-dioxygenase [Nocardia asteroides]UGT61852.1 homogentisate 1,2-dioxygenase [Nocardia asteroides]
MAYYRTVGQIPPKRHTQFRRDTGELYSEELAGADGFSGDSSLLYHRGIPSAITTAEPWEPGDLSLEPNVPLLPRHLRLHLLFTTADATDLVTGRRLILGNADVRISYAVAGVPSPLYRSAIGDECVYIEQGAGVIETVFGALDFRTGDYVLIPRATIHRWLPAEGAPVRAYVIEATGHIAPPKRYLSRFGQFLEHAPYCERDLHGPTTPLLREGTDVPLLVKHRGPAGIAGTRYVLPTHPFDVVGWDGCLYPYTFNIGDFEPITGRIHQPPPVHQVFEGRNFVVCNFVPRKVDYHPLAVPVPYHHSNTDSDEVMFYCGGDYEAREGAGIEKGSVSLHPGGHTHGPQPGAMENSIGRERFDELAVMIDTFAPLQLGEGARATDDGVYFRSWSR